MLHLVGYILEYIYTIHGTRNVKFANNTSKWQIEFNSEFKGLKKFLCDRRE
jgi:hypothetical protein